jgi:ABC-type branched-subunit amino acid transport system substrate-binding protein
MLRCIVSFSVVIGMLGCIEVNSGEFRCGEDKSCPTGMYCSQVWCLDDTCTQSSDCSGGAYCDLEANRCLLPANGAPGVSSSTIYLGFSGRLTAGDSDPSTHYRNGIVAALNRVNSNGGVLGRYLSLRAVDDGGQATRARANISTMISNEQVFAFLGNAGSNTMQDSVEVVKERQQLLFAPHSASPLLYLVPPSRYIYNFRPSLLQELTAAVSYTLVHAPPQVPQKNLAAFVEAEREDVALTTFGQDVWNALSQAVQNPTLHLFKYTKYSVDVDLAVEQGLHWLASGLEDNGSGIDALFVLGATPDSGASFVKNMLDNLHAIKRGETTEFMLSAAEKAALQDVNDVYFWIPSVVGSYFVASTLHQAGSYTSTDGEHSYCGQVFASQIVPSPNSNEPANITFREAMAAANIQAEANYTALEGYIAAQLFVRGLKRISTDFSVEGLSDQLEGLQDVDLGFGESYGFGSADHQAGQKVYLTRFDDNCDEIPLQSVQVQ